MFDRDLERLNRKTASGNVHVVDLGNKPLSPVDRGTGRDVDTYFTRGVRKQSSFVMSVCDMMEAGAYAGAYAPR